jgi:hypothetical protein
MSTHIINFPGADINTTKLTVGTGGVNVDDGTFVVDAQTNRIGVGTQNPAFGLDVYGTANVGILTSTRLYTSGGLVTNTDQVAKKTYSYSGTIGNTEQPQINVCFTNESFNAKITAQLIEGDDEISTISFECCGGNKSGTLPASNIQTGSIQVFGPASTNPWNSTVVTDKTTVAMKPSGAIDTSGEYHIFVEYTSAKSGGATSNIVQDTTQKIAFGY